MAWFQEHGASLLVGLIFLSLILRGPLLARFYHIKSMTVHELSARLGAKPPILLIDVRRPAEVSNGCVDQARPIPLGELHGRLEEVRKMAKNGEVAVICQSGGRSLMAAVTLKKAGISSVYNISGGMGHWQGQGYPVRRR